MRDNTLIAAEIEASSPAANAARPDARRTLVFAGIAHALHDGYTDLIYVLLPLWQAEFGLGYAMLALIRGLYAGAMAILQLPAGHLAQRFGGRAILALGTAVAAIGFLMVGASNTVIGLCLGLALSGAGSSVQHPIASSAVARAYGDAARGPLGTYNFTGDIGKAAFPALIALLLSWLSWRASLDLIALLGLACAFVLIIFMPIVRFEPGHHESAVGGGADRNGFSILFAMGILDSAVRMGFLTFLPFLLLSKGASLPTVGVALTLIFIGGAVGKFGCGWLGSRLGMLRTVLLTEISTGALILLLLALPLSMSLVLMPLLGFMLNGTSSVLYGSVPELVPSDRTERAFAIFYTGTIGSGAAAPILYGVLGDMVGAGSAIVATGLTALAICPLAVALAPKLAPQP